MQIRPPALIPRERRLELPERLDYLGNVLRAPTADKYEKLLLQLRECKPESIAISLLYSFRNNEHEQSLSRLLHEQFPMCTFHCPVKFCPNFENMNEPAL